MAGRVALPRPVALGTLGVRVMVERMVGRGREEEEVGAEEGSKDTEEDRGGSVEDTETDVGELRLEDEGEDLAVPLAWFWT